MRKQSEIISVFGQIEEVAANHLLRKYPDLTRKIPKEQFPSRVHCPNVWTNSSGVEASFALRLPNSLLPEFRETVVRLRS